MIMHGKIPVMTEGEVSFGEYLASLAPQLFPHYRKATDGEIELNERWIESIEHEGADLKP